MPTPALRVAAPLDEALLFQPVEHADELAAVETQGIGDRRLGLAGALGEHGQHAVLVEAEARPLELLDREELDREAEPHEQERRAAAQLLWECDGLLELR